MKTARTSIALTIAGSDSSGGAGIQADLKTFSAFGVYGASAITALTAQNTRGVAAVEPVAASFVVAQIEAVLVDLDVGAIKTGMLANADIVEAVARCLRAGPRLPVVVDPVMVATSGDALLTADAVEAVKRQLVPLASLITPNLPEAARLLGAKEAADDAQAIEQAKALHGLGCGAVLLKGGHGVGATAVGYPLRQRRHRALRAAPHRHPPHPRHGLHAIGCHSRSAGPGYNAQRGCCPRQRLRVAGLGSRAGAGCRPWQRPGRPPVRHPPHSPAGVRCGM